MTAYERYHQNTAGLHYKGLDNLGKPIVLDAAETSPGRFEVAALRPSGDELSSVIVQSLEEAKRVYERLYAHYIANATEQAPAPLTGKYAKLRDDLRAVYQIGIAAAEKVDDGGTCNLDAPALHLPRWNRNKIEQACAEAGCGCFRWDFVGSYVICFRIPGQARKREVAAEAMTQALAGIGYDAITYCQMD